MIVLITLISITSILVLGVTIVTQPGMILHSIRSWAEKKESKIYEPIILCHWCMASLWSSVGYFFALITRIISWEWSLVFYYPLVVCGSSIACGVTWGLYKKIESESNYFSNVEKLTHWDIVDRKKYFKQNNSVKR